MGGSVQDFINECRWSYRRKILFGIICMVLVVVMLFITIAMGKYNISFLDSYRVFMDNLLGHSSGTRDDLIIWDYRVPRAIMAIFVGASLSIAGAVMQNLMRNPLAEPFTMGISSGAFLGAVFSIVGGISIIPFIAGDEATVVNAFLMSLVPVGLIMVISKYRKTTPTTMILCGISIMYIFSSVSTLLMVMADPTHLSEAYSWRIGTLGKADWSELPIVVPSMIVLMILLLCLSKHLNTLSAGDKAAMSLGTDPYLTRIVALVIVALLTAFAVSFTGTIGFVGLVAPHIVRIFIGSNNKYLLLACACFGAFFLLTMDSLAKVVSETGLPVGVICAMIGGPIFIYILIQQRKKIWY
ncbi:MAG: iron ABC transporter permease [Candidatus Methanoplasma sp.]|jgi:ABC-type Fe3+-siderophore transport system permease subunit|nr:iron ABC transporter permease [Candidatus Methanoplasma sp.]